MNEFLSFFLSKLMVIFILDNANGRILSSIFLTRKCDFKWLRIAVKFGLPFLLNAILIRSECLLLSDLNLQQKNAFLISILFCNTTKSELIRKWKSINFLRSFLTTNWAISSGARINPISSSISNSSSSTLSETWSNISIDRYYRL